MKFAKRQIFIFAIIVAFISFTIASDKFLAAKSETELEERFAYTFGTRNDSSKNDSKKNDTNKDDNKKDDNKKDDKKKGDDSKKNDTKKDDAKKNDTKKNDTKKNDTKKNDTKKNDTENTKVYKNKNSSNVVGEVGPANFSVAKSPYKVESCDQVLMMNGTMIVNMKDYCTRVKTFFTMDMYMINLFGSKNSSSLVKSINLQDITEYPQILPGSATCIQFMDINNSKNISMCMATKDEVKDVLRAYTDFIRCRLGMNLHIDWKFLFLTECMKDNNKFKNMTKLAFNLKGKEIKKMQGSLDFLNNFGINIEKDLQKDMKKNNKTKNGNKTHISDEQQYKKWLKEYYARVPGT